MDLSALIFVALAVAWAVYLVPKALKYHEEDSAHRSVDGFSDRMRVVARREAVSRTEAELVPAGREPGDRAKVVEKLVEQVEIVEQVEVVETVESVRSVEVRDEEPAAPTPAPRALAPTSVARPAARRAAARRRRVFNVLLLALVVTTALAVGKVIGWAWIAAPATLMAAWLVACRLMVRRERAARAAVAPVRRRRRTLADEVIAAEDAQDAHGDDDVVGDDARDEEAAPAVRFDDTDEIPVITAEVLDDEPAVDGWTPVPVPLPTYVAKAPAGRTVRTIDLDSTGVWSSGRNEIDSQIAREADAQRAQAEADADVERRASGS